MQTKLTTYVSLLLITILFISLVFINSKLLAPYRIDLTENQVYSLSEGSKKVIESIDEPINLYFFFSNKASKNMVSLRNYANRVESLLNEYETLAKGKLKLHILDPEAFSEEEDKADQFGLTAASIGAAGERVYLGLAATNALDDQQVIAFFDPQKESFLEYETSKLIYQLTDPNPINVTLITDLPVAGGQNPMSGQMEPEWSFYTQLQQLFKVESFDSKASGIPDNTDVLVLIDPKGVSENLLFSIDQFAMQGGKVLAFVDPINESDPFAMGGAVEPNANKSNILSLLEAWGVHFDNQSVLLDAMSGLDIRTQDGGVARHFGFVGLSNEQLNKGDVVTSSLDVINGASFGVIDLTDDSQLSFLPLIQSSENSDLISTEQYASSRDPDELAKAYESQNQTYVVAARVSGNAKSMFTQVPDTLEASSLKRKLVTSTNNLNLILVGDSDVLSDRFWVQQSNFFGQTIFTPFANNGDFIINAVENFGGSDALISIRSRGTFARSFNKVDELTVIAEQEFREQEQLLEAQLADTEQQLLQLQSQQSDLGNLVITPEQQIAIDEYMDKKITIRKSLRNVRHQLDNDIETLGNWLKLINIVFAPILLILLLVVVRTLITTKFRIKTQNIKDVPVV
ncbi:MAG: Gldg family protein [Paraglaciecola sp.]|uniref:GldG family protein n=1 Tax=Paraglaciecola sp. TaxID=1920173 RepID=UPI003297EDA1